MTKKEIIFLGTGAANVTKYANYSFYIREGNNSILIDTGGGSQILANLEKTKINIEDIKYIFITHEHLDHILGLFPLLRKISAKMKKNKNLKLTIFCSHKLEKIIRNFVAALQIKKVIELFYESRVKLKIIDDNQIASIANWQIQFINTQSNKLEQFGLSLKFADGKKLICLGDERYKDSLYSHCLNADYFIHEAFCLERDRKIFKPETMNHSTVKEVSIIAEKLHIKNLILIHTEDKTFEKRKMLYSKEAKKYFSGAVFIPDDLEIIKTK